MIKIDFTRELGKIKPMHAVGQPPFSGGFQSYDFSPMQRLKDAHVPYSRLHDVGGAFGGNKFVDVPNVFRDFDADENDPASYDFAFTDALLKAMHEYGLEPIYRLGVTIENQCFIKPYRIFPPKDFAKWARICEHIVRHYNEGWADGFHFGITYWEIWNEPDNAGEWPADGKSDDRGRLNQMWAGPREKYYELYEVTAKHLKACFGDSIKVGGFGSCGFYAVNYEPEKYGVKPVSGTDPDRRRGRMSEWEYYIKFFEEFFEHVKKTGAPIDFFSWHSYSNAEHTGQMADYVEKALEKYGFAGLETQLNEWNPAHKPDNMFTPYASAQTAAMMCAMQNKKTDILCFYDARTQGSAYGMFNCYTGEPFPCYYAILAFGKLYALGTQVACDCGEDGVYAIAAKGGDGRAALISNVGGDRELTLSGTDGMTVYIINGGAPQKTDRDPRRFTLAENEVALLLS